MPPPNICIYIDGFNLYYGALRGTRHKWLNLEAYFRLLRPHDHVVSIRYFTALVSGPAKERQEPYLRALETLPKVETILGKFKKSTVECTNSQCTLATDRRFFKRKEEKRTDVSIGLWMLDDAYQDRCEHLILVSGDSDLVPAVQMVRGRFPQKRITVYVPANNPLRGAAVELRASAHTNRNLPLQLLPRAQFPAQIPDGGGGQIIKPPAW